MQIDYLLFFLLLLYEFPVVGQQISFQNYTSDDGLPADVIYEVVQDKQGFTWIATDNGLARFDGQGFRVFRNKPGDPATIADNSITSLTISHDSAFLWLGTFQGLSVIDLHSGEIKSYAHDLRGVNHFPVRNAKCFYEDSSGAMWIGSDEGLIFWPDFKLPFQFFRLRISDNPNDFSFQYRNIGKIVAYPGDSAKLLLGTAGGLVVFEKERGRIIHHFDMEALDSRNISDIYVDDKNIVWTAGWLTGLCRVDLLSGKWERMAVEPGLPNSFVSIIRRNEQELWLGSPGNGVGIFNIKTNTLNFLKSDPANPRSIVSNTVQRLNQMGKNQQVWVSTTDGLCMEDKQSGFFLNVIPPFPYFWISHFNKDEKKNILFAGAYCCQGLFAFDINNKQWSLIPYEPYEGWDYLDINTLFRDRAGRLWLGTRTNLYYYDEKKVVVKLWRDENGNPIPLQGPVIYAIKEDPAGNLWIGTVREGVVCIDKNRKICRLFPNDKNESGKLNSGFSIRTIEHDSYGRVWIAGRDGLSIFLPDEKKFFVVPADTFLKNGIRYNYIYSMVRDRKGRMWLSMDRLGLVRVIADRNLNFQFKLFQTSQGLDDLIIKYLNLDARGELWICNNALVHFNPNNETTKAFDSRNGLNSRLTGDSKIYVDAGNTIYIGGDVGFETARLEDLVLTSGISNLLIDGLEVNGKPYFSGLRMNLPSEVKLLAGQRNLTFLFTAICYQSYEKLKFSFRLMGYDKDWTMGVTAHEARYTNLPPGKYNFQVKASYRGIYYHKTTEITVVIPPYFWQTWWFVLLSIIIIIIIIVGIYRYRINQLLKIERIRNRIATDLHDEVSSTLSGIAIISEIVAGSLNDPKPVKMLGDVVVKSRSLLEKMDDIVWLVNPRNDLFANLGLRIREFAIPLFESKGINFRIEFDEQLQKMHLGMDVRRNVYLITKEAVNNLVKYSGCQNAVISISEKAGGLLLIISDDGKGFDPELPTSRNGLKNMRSRAEQIHSKLEISSVSGQGSTIKLHVRII